MTQLSPDRRLEAVAIATLNRECFGKDDDYSNQSTLEKYLLSGGDGFVILDARNPDVGMGYWLANDGRPAVLQRYGVSSVYRGKGIAGMLFKELWSRYLVARTYVAGTNYASQNALMRGGFQVMASEAGWMHLLGGDWPALKAYDKDRRDDKKKGK